MVLEVISLRPRRRGRPCLSACQRACDNNNKRTALGLWGRGEEGRGVGGGVGRCTRTPLSVSLEAAHRVQRALSLADTLHPRYSRLTNSEDGRSVENVDYPPVHVRVCMLAAPPCTERSSSSSRSSLSLAVVGNLHPPRLRASQTLSLGPLNRGPHVALSNFRNAHVALSNFRNAHVPRR